MMTLRCTAKMLRRLGQPGLADGGPPTNALGDGYVNLVRVGHEQLVMATSERSLLTALPPAKDVKRSLHRGLCATVHRLLMIIGVPEPVASREVGHMNDHAIGKTASRRLLGRYLRQWPLWEVMAQLADTPMLCTGKGIVAGLHLPSDAPMHLLGLPRTAVADRRRTDFNG